ncbi:MAG: ABC transporter permease [Chitinophagaceae bacterium]|nr:ABC transporter permease [Chitinophagaceae bacterium]MCW5904172.1 ABC transporter permease [Chitinophagaceae bacterium]
MTLSDTVQLAFRTVRGNKLRTGITVAIIAFGIMALIGIITAITAMEHSLKESFSVMGANAFSIRYKEMTIRIGGGGNKSEVNKKGKKEKKSNLNKYIVKDEAEYFKANYTYPAIVSIFKRGNNGVECSYGNKKTNPITTVMGGDENYLAVNGYTITNGRNLNNIDVSSGRNVCLIGSNTAKTLFGENPEKSVDKIIRVGGLPYRVIGLLKEKGSSGFLRMDDIVITTYTNVLKIPSTNAAASFMIGVLANNVAAMDMAIEEATATFRGVRKLHPTEANNFAIEKSDKVAEMFIGFLSGISGSAGAIGMITLIGAAIGLMNIMLVAVNERTREVGLIKAIGGKSKSVRAQFLFESILISLMGAAFGIALGILVGNIFASYLETGFIVPWNWVIGGIIICTIVGLLAGLYPAIKASKLNPINALRYE